MRKREERRKQVETCFELVSDFTVIRYNGNIADDEYRFRYAGVMTKGLPAAILLDIKRINPHLIKCHRLTFPRLTNEEQSKYEERWGTLIEEANKAGKVENRITRELPIDDAISVCMHNYIKSADIEDISKEPEDITRKGVFVRDRVFGGVRGDFFLCKRSGVLEILMNSKELSQRLANGILSREIIDALDYRVVQGKVNVKLKSGKIKQYRVWGIPLKAGTRCLKYGKGGLE